MKRRIALSALSVAVALVAPATSLAAGAHEDLDARTGHIAPSEAQKRLAAALGASVDWNRFGTPRSIVNHNGFLATRVPGATASAAARNWVAANTTLFRLTSTNTLKLLSETPLARSQGFAVHFRQEFGGLPAAEGGLLTVGLTGSSGSWSVAYASSSVTGSTALAAAPTLSPVDAWRKAATNPARFVNIGTVEKQGEWSVFGVEGLVQPQRARLVALPTPANGVRPAYETIFLDVRGGHAVARQTFVDAVTGAVWIRKDIVEQSHPPVATFAGTVPPG